MERASAPDLPAFYYLENYRYLIDSVYLLYDDLLTADERNFYRQFLQLSQAAQALYVRLLCRVGDHFRLSKIHYPEIPGKAVAIAELSKSGFLRTPATCPETVLLSLFTKSEWLSYFNNPVLKHQKKEALLIPIANRGGHVLADMLGKLGDKLICVELAEHFTTFKLLFFGNTRQDLTDFVLADLGIFRYENYPLHKQTRLFQQRSQINHMLHYFQLREILEPLSTLSIDALLDIHRALPRLSALDCTADMAERAINRRMQGLRISIARQLERLKQPEVALSIYRECLHPPSRERQVRLLNTLQRFDEALELCRQMEASDSEAERLFADEFSARLKKKLKRKVTTKTTLPIASEQLSLKPEPDLAVEQQVANYFSDSGRCFYVENRLFLGVFGLVFWPVVFADIPGAFTHPLQSAPHDLYHSDFLNARRAELEACWNKLSHYVEKPQSLIDKINQKSGITNTLVNWEVLKPELVTLALTHIPLADWQTIFRRLWSNLRENRNGLPDLIYFPNNKSNSYQLIEVKAPRDRLQQNQKRWLTYFQQKHIPSTVLYVDWRD